jgi:hypothetical protein
MQWRITFPVVGGELGHNALHGGGGIVAGLSSRLAIVFPWHHHPSAIRIEQNLGRIEAQAARRVGRPMHAVAVDLARFHSRHEGVPIVICSMDAWIQFDGSTGPGVVRPVEEQQFHALRIARKKTEVRALPDNAGPEGMAAAGVCVRFHVGGTPLNQTGGT